MRKLTILALLLAPHAARQALAVSREDFEQLDDSAALNISIVQTTP